MEDIVKSVVESAVNRQSHQNIIDAMNVINQALAEGVKAQRFMVAVWSVDENNKLTLQTRTTWRFPTVLFLDAMSLLQAKIDEELALKRPEPLPVADILTPEKRAGWEPIPEKAFEKEEQCDD